MILSTRGFVYGFWGIDLYNAKVEPEVGDTSTTFLYTCDFKIYMDFWNSGLAKFYYNNNGPFSVSYTTTKMVDYYYYGYFKAYVNGSNLKEFPETNSFKFEYIYGGIAQDSDSGNGPVVYPCLTQTPTITETATNTISVKLTRLHSRKARHTSGEQFRF